MLTAQALALVAFIASTEPAPPVPTVANLFAASGIVGMSTATVTDARIRTVEHFGVRHVETGAPVDDATVFEAASLTKPVVAYTALRLADREELDLDAPLLGIVAYERLADDALASQITARMVLSHTSGLPNWGGTPLERNFEPGSSWGYSGEGYVLLGRALETISGQRLDDLVRRECFDPLEMTSSSLRWRDASREGASQRTLLIPLGDGNFALDGIPWFRLRLETDAEGRNVAAVGLYADGRTDRTESPHPEP